MTPDYVDLGLIGIPATASFIGSNWKSFTVLEAFQAGVPFGHREHSGKRAGLAKPSGPSIGAQQGVFRCAVAS
jgi:hypothetical protein